MAKQFTYEVGSFVGDYEVVRRIRIIPFGEVYRVISILAEEEIYDLLYIPVETGSTYLDKMRAFRKMNKAVTKFFQKKPADFFLNPVELISENNPAKELEILYFLYPENSLQTPLANSIDWNEETFQATPQKDSATLDIVIQVARALLELHNAGAFHSFVSPDYIFQVDGVWKLAIPGLALLTASMDGNVKSVAEDYSDLNVFPLAPEVIKVIRNLQPEADVWSLGILLSILSSGELPFYFKTERDYLSQIRSGNLELKLKNIPALFTEFISHCLNMVPRDRTGLADFVEVLESLASRIGLEEGEGGNDGETPLPDSELSAPEVADERPQPWIELKRLDAKSELNPGEEIRLILTINPTLRLDSEDLIRNGKRITVEALNNALKSDKALGHQVFEVPILPKPRFKVNRDESFLNKDSESDELFNGQINLRLTQSRVIIRRVELKLDNPELNDLNISLLPISNQLLNAHDTFKIDFSVSGEVTLNEPLEIKCYLHLLNRSEPEVVGIKITPRAPADLHIVGQLKRMIKVYVGNHNVIHIKIANRGGLPAIVQYHKFVPEHSFAEINMVDKEIPAKGERFMEVAINATGKRQTQGYNCHIEIGYMESMPNGVTLHKTARFETVIQILELEPSETLSMDFGTTNTCLAYREKGVIKVIKVETINDEKFDPETIPSIVYYSRRNDNPIVGRDAKRAFLARELNVFYSIKRFINSEQKKLLIFPPDNPMVKYYEQMIIDYIREVLNETTLVTGKKFEKYIFTHPTDLTKPAREKYLDLLVKAGIDEQQIDLIDEATAGALNYAEVVSSDQEEDFWILVYDFGGGTTDVVFGRYSKEAPEGPFGKSAWLYKPHKQGGDTRLGGDDVTLMIINCILKIFNKAKLVIPFLSPFDDKLYAFSESEQKIVGDNSTTLWNFGEYIKINIQRLVAGDFKPEEIKSRLFPFLDAIRLGEQDLPKTWQFQSSNQERIARDNKILNEVDWQAFARNVFQVVGQRLQEAVTDALNLCRNAVDRGDIVKIVLLGKSSRFPIVEPLFKHFLGLEPFESEKFGFSPTDFQFPTEHQCAVSLPEKLKSVVASGAIHKSDGMKTDAIDETLTLDIGVRTGGGKSAFFPLLRAGTKKIPVDNENGDILAKFRENKDEWAVYVGKPYKTTRTFSQNIFQLTGDAARGRQIGTISINLSNEESGQECQLILYMNAEEDLHWMLINEQQHVLKSGIVQ